MFARVTAKNVGILFLDSVYATQDIVVTMLSSER